MYSEIVPASMPVAQMLARRPKAIILSGGPASVYAPGAPPAPDGMFQAGVPILGICYGFQLMVSGLGGTVQRTSGGEYGATALEVLPGAAGARRAARRPARPSSRCGCRTATRAPPPPPGFTVTARTAGTPVAAAEDPARGLYGVQFHPEVLHTAHGMEMLRQFLAAAGCRPTWTMRGVIEEQTERIAAQVGDGRAICGLSGGVDSAVAAALVQRAIGYRLTCVFVDHGLLRTGEAEQVEKDFVAATGVDLTVVDAAAEFLAALAGVDRSRGEAQDHRPGVHPRVRAGRPRDHRGGRAGQGGRASEHDVPGPGHAVPGRGRVGRRQRRRPTSSPTTTSAGSPTTWRSSWSSRCGRCSRTRCARSAASSGCPRRSCGGSRSPAPAWRSGSSAR